MINGYHRSIIVKSAILRKTLQIRAYLMDLRWKGIFQRTTKNDTETKLMFLNDFKFFWGGIISWIITWWVYVGIITWWIKVRFMWQFSTEKNGKETQVNSFQRVLSYCSKEFAGRKVKSGKGGGGDFELSEIFKLWIFPLFLHSLYILLSQIFMLLSVQCISLVFLLFPQCKLILNHFNN